MSVPLLTADDIRAALRPKAQPRLLLANVRAAVALSELGGQHEMSDRGWRSTTGLVGADLWQWIDGVWHGERHGNDRRSILLSLPEMNRRARTRAKQRDRMRARRAKQRP